MIKFDLVSQVLQSEPPAMRLAEIGWPRPPLWQAAIIASLLLWMYIPTLAHLVAQWWNDPNFSHGFFVPLFSAFVIWHRRSQFSDVSLRPSWWG
ncbi:MAG: archaeosortase/exosortase family protein, partial [Candidatus Sulfotelmatobacter sp.]